MIQKLSSVYVCEKNVATMYVKRMLLLFCAVMIVLLIAGI